VAGIPVEWCVGAREVGEPRLSPDGGRLGVAITVDGIATIDVYDLWTEGGGEGGDEGGHEGEPTARRVVHTPSPRPGRGLGGGGWTWSGDGTSIIYAAVDGNLWSQPVRGGASRRLTDHGPERVAQAPAAAPSGGRVVYVVDQSEVWLVDADADDPAAAATRLDDGSADFCFDPVVLPDGGAVAWHAWNVPEMPWDASRMERLDLVTGARTQVRGGGMLQQPRPMPDGRIVCVRDDHGWANVWLDDSPLVDEPVEHAGPTWSLGLRSFAVSPDGHRVAFTRNERGFGRLCVVDLDSGAIDEIGRGVHGQLSWHANRLAAVRTGARTPTQVVLYEESAAGVHPAWTRRVVVAGPTARWSDAPLVEPELVCVPVSAVGGDDDTPADVHARFYRADPSGDSSADPPRLICWLHGGPTDQWQVTFMPRIAYWRSLGWNVLVPDHRGSTGHGRAYQQALRGQWGELDVDDTLAHRSKNRPRFLERRLRSTDEKVQLTCRRM